MAGAAALPEVRWLWNGELEQAALRSQLHALAAGGVQAAVVWPWAGLERSHLLDAYHARLQAVCADAAALGVTLWLADDHCWPSGAAGGRLLRARPDLAQRALLVQSRWLRSAGAPQTVSWRGEGERLVLAAALGTGGARRDLTRMLEANGHPIHERRTSRFGGQRVPWHAELWEAEITLPPGDWFVVTAAVARTHPLFPAVLGAAWTEPVTGVLDTLNPAAVEAFLELTYAPLAVALDPWLGSTIAGFITVPPALPAMHDLPDNPGWRLDALPWTTGLESAWPSGGAPGFLRDFPYMVARLHDRAAIDADPLAPVRALAVAHEAAAYRQPLRAWCAAHDVNLLSLDAAALDDMPALAYSLRADRKGAIPAHTLVGVPLSSPGAGCSAPAVIWPRGTVPDGDEPDLRHDAGTQMDGLGPVWRWQPLSLNAHALYGWARVPGAFGERLRLRATFEAEYLPEDLCLVIEAGTVEAVTLNGAGMDLTRARMPSEAQVELADVCYRVLPLRPHPALRYGSNQIDLTAYVPVAERLTFPGVDERELIGPLFLAGSFALRPIVGDKRNAARMALARPPIEVTLGEWAGLGYPRFSGSAVYEQAIVASDHTPGRRVQLVATAPGCHVTVALNGEPATPGADGRFELGCALRPGINQLAVCVTSGPAARLTGAASGGLLDVCLLRPRAGP